MSTIRYLLDENLTHAIRDQLLRHESEITVFCVGDPEAPPLGKPDPVILEWLEEHDYILVSRNRRTMPVHFQAHLARNRKIPGLLLLRRGVSIGQIIEALLLIWHASSTEEYLNQIKYIPL